jgi:hypothetical protein
MSSLVPKQVAFTYDIALLILMAHRLGYYLTFGEAYRMPNAKHGLKNSLHKKRLAVDFNLFLMKNGKLVWQRSTKAHKVIGELWEQLGNTWGGRFNDGNHYSKEHQGVK